MASKLREELAAELSATVEKLRADKEAIEESMRTLTNSIRELRGSGPRHPRRVGTSDALEHEFLAALKGNGGKATGEELVALTKRNSGTLYNVFVRLEHKGYARRPGDKVGRSFIHEITSLGEEALAASEAEANGAVAKEEAKAAVEQAKPEPEPEPEKPKRRKHRAPRKMDRDEKVRRIRELLADGKPHQEADIIRQTGIYRKWLKQNLPELEREGIVETYTVPDKTIPVGYKVMWHQPARTRETVAHPGDREPVRLGRLIGSPR